MLDAPQVLAVESPQSGKLQARIRADRNARSFVGRIKQANGSGYGPTISFASSRKIVFDGLTAGLIYVFQLCAIGGSTARAIGAIRPKGWRNRCVPKLELGK